MSELTILRDLLVIFAVAVTVVALLHRAGVPTIAGFILAGTIAGPRALGLIEDTHQVEMLAEIGIALLLFGIGLELSLQRLRRLWKPILIGGALQVSLTILTATLIAKALGLPMASAIFLGCLLATSSTAIVLRGLMHRGELDAPHGRLTLGILVFQDLCVVPIILVIPWLSGSSDPETSIPAALLKTIAVLVGTLLAARIIVPKLLNLIAKTRQRDLFALSVFLVCIGTAWIVSEAGVSLALGAFFGGLVIASSRYRHQALAELIPFREVFTSVFFISVGMLLDPQILWTHRGPVLLLLLAILGGKALIVFISGVIMRLPLRVSILAAFALAQVGEFSFVLAHAAEGTNLIEPGLANNLLAATILSMLITPLTLAAGPHLAAGVGRFRTLTRLLDVNPAADARKSVDRWQGHVIIAGYGVAGQELAKSMKKCSIPYLVVGLNSENVRHAIAAGHPAYFGDVTSAEVLEHLRADQAQELVIVINDPNAAERAVAAARRVAPNLHIVVRSRYLGDMEPLLAAGASKVIPAELEAAVEATSHVLVRHEIAPKLVEEELERVRKRREDVFENGGKVS